MQKTTTSLTSAMPAVIQIIQSVCKEYEGAGIASVGTTPR